MLIRDPLTEIKPLPPQQRPRQAVIYSAAGIHRFDFDDAECDFTHSVHFAADMLDAGFHCYRLGASFHFIPKGGVQ